MRLRLLLTGLAGTVLFAAVASQAQSPAPPPADAVQALQERIAAGRLSLASGPAGYLPGVLAALDIPVDSQILVFSKTSLQFHEISPKTPRALYFNDDTVVGFVQGGDLIEITTTGADGRIAFYTLQSPAAGAPLRVNREGPVCLACHAAADPWAPGLLVANVIPMEDGTPLFVDATRLFQVTDSTTSFRERWGGWYVTGRHGALRHNGNVQITDQSAMDGDLTGGGNVTDLAGRFDTSAYLAPTSDIVALMTFEHQLGVSNRIWRLHAQARGLAGQGRSASAAELDATIEALAGYMLGAGEAPLDGPVTGVSGFTESFAARGPRDPRGRSLRDFDLQTRLFRYPVSFMVYSRVFDGLPPELRGRLARRMVEVLEGRDRSARFAHITPEAGRAALEILAATKPALLREAAAAAPSTTRSAG